jgi:hypothetical protein
LQRFSGSKPSFEQPAMAFPLAKTKITHASITTDIILALLPGKTSPDVIFSVPVCHFPKENLVAFFR